MPASRRTVAAFASRLRFISHTYRTRSRALRATSGEISERLGTPLVGDIVTRFVNFHRAIYAHPFTTEIGEYAVPIRR
jgi:hypothetical protein